MIKTLFSNGPMSMVPLNLIAPRLRRFSASNAGNMGGNPDLSRANMSSMDTGIGRPSAVSEILQRPISQPGPGGIFRQPFNAGNMGGDLDFLSRATIGPLTSLTGPGGVRRFGPTPYPNLMPSINRRPISQPGLGGITPQFDGTGSTNPGYINPLQLGPGGIPRFRFFCGTGAGGIRPSQPGFGGALRPTRNISGIRGL